MNKKGRRTNAETKSLWQTVTKSVAEEETSRKEAARDLREGLTEALNGKVYGEHDAIPPAVSVHEFAEYYRATAHPVVGEEGLTDQTQWAELTDKIAFAMKQLSIEWIRDKSTWAKSTRVHRLYQEILLTLDIDFLDIIGAGIQAFVFEFSCSSFLRACQVLNEESRLPPSVQTWNSFEREFLDFCADFYIFLIENEVSYAELEPVDRMLYFDTGLTLARNRQFPVMAYAYNCLIAAERAPRDKTIQALHRKPRFTIKEVLFALDKLRPGFYLENKFVAAEFVAELTGFHPQKVREHITYPDRWKSYKDENEGSRVLGFLEKLKIN